MIIIGLVVFTNNIYAYTTFDYNKDSYGSNFLREVMENDSPKLVLLSTDTSFKINRTRFNIPTKGVVSSEYGYRWNGFHKGIDIAANKGVGIYAAASGVVEYASELDTYGLMVKINHENGYETIYAHCSKILIKIGDVISRGDKIAEVGNTGNSTGNHLHFEVIQNGERRDPRNYFLQPLQDYSV